MTHIPFTARALLVIAAGLDEIRWHFTAPVRWRRNAESGARAPITEDGS